MRGARLGHRVSETAKTRHFVPSCLAPWQSHAALSYYVRS